VEVNSTTAVGAIGDFTAKLKECQKQNSQHGSWLLKI